MADNRTMAQLLQAPAEGYEDAIVIPEIAATNFELKHGLINLVQNKQFFRHDKEDPHAHIRYLNKISSTMKFFPPSKMINLRNEITRFQQRFNESFSEAWDRFSDLVRACPHHGFSELHQLDTFYNALNFNDQDSLNFASGGNFLDKMAVDCLKIIESKSKVRQARAKAVVSKVNSSSSTPAISSDVAELKDMVRALLLDKKNQYSAPAPSPTSAPIKAVEPNCVTCGGTHAYQNCPATSGNVYQDNIQEYVSQAATTNYGVNSSSSTPAISSDVAELKDMVRALLLDKKNQYSALAPSPTPAPIKAVEPNCVTCGGTHAYQNCPATSGNVYQDNIQEYVSQAATTNYGQGNTGFLPQMVANQIRPPGFPPVQNSQNNFNWGNNFKQNRGGNFNQSNFNQSQLHRPQVNQHLAYQAPAYQAPVPQTQRSGTLPSNTITHPKEDLKGPTIPTSSKVTKQRTEVTKDQVKTLSSQSTAAIQPPIIQSEYETPVSEPVVAPVSAPMPNLKPSIPYPLSFTDALILMPKFASTLKALIGNKEKLSEMARTSMNEHYSVVILNKFPRKLRDPGKFLIPCEFPRMDECLALADLDASINLMPLSVWKGLSLPELTPTCMTLKLADRSVSKPIGIAEYVSVKIGRSLNDVHKGELTLRIGNEAITYNLDQTSSYSANYDQMTANKIDVTDEACEEYSQEVLGFSDVTASGSPTPSDDLIVSTTTALYSTLKELKACKAKTIKSSIDEPPEVELKDLSPHLEYVFLEGDNKLAVIIAKEFGEEEKSSLIKGTSTIVSLMVSSGIFKFPLTHMIR
nr:hypothetical protein [Tanacetum cinerariifolium]